MGKEDSPSCPAQKPYGFDFAQRSDYQSTPVDVWIARAGVEIGAFREKDLRDLARAGELEPTDHYWYSGMEDWDLLGNLLGPETWNPREPPSLPPSYKRPAVLVVATICGAVILFGVVALLVARATGLKRPSPALATAPSAQDLSRTEAKSREAAAAELRARVQRLPRAATPPLYTSYSELTLSIPDPPSPLVATISGKEDMVDPATQNPTVRTSFTIATAYQSGQWMYKSYWASRIDLTTDDRVEVEDDEEAPIPPSIVSVLGLKTGER